MMFKRHWLSIVCGGGLSLLATSAFASEPVKSAKQCDSEMRANLRAIEAAGETLPRFFHDCWWNSTPGKPTVIVKDGTMPMPDRGTTREADRDATPRHPVVGKPVRVGRRSAPRGHALAQVALAWARPRVERRPEPRRIEPARRSYAGRPNIGAPTIAERPIMRTRVARIAWSADPPGFSEARRIWIRQADPWGGSGSLFPAVIVEPVRPGAMDRGGLKCWMQPVLFERRRRDRTWRWSLACDGLTAPWAPPAAPRVSFAGYASSRMPRVARRETWYE